ncbi:GNAT family N-acetyltransferase [Rhodococcus rhodochrous]|uniref:GNAT family N-acetyltransferase n=1 Tax=Rhodococcus rhodochrous TaxID=1829 RepID=UPI0013216FF9|nr:GNAT family N-acetyltransferase [Rhodococcus pyridinivorans]MXQ77533.1 GNAT family N-acetyltransferase [Rhodococcus rhodochrous]
MSNDHVVRPATVHDVEKATATLGRAFRDYPFTRYTVDGRDHETRVRDLQGLFLAEIGMRCGEVWVSDDVDAVAVWTTPGSTGLAEAFASVADRVTELRGDRARAAELAEQATAKLQPSEPVWFLATVGVDPASQGRGLGRAVLEPGLRAAERQGVAACLETSSEANVALYERLGFVVTGVVELPDGGPKVWAMRR